MTAKENIEMFKEIVENLIMEYLGISNKFKIYCHYIALNKYLNY